MVSAGRAAVRKAAEKGLKPTGTSRSVATPPLAAAGQELVSLGDPELRLVQSADGGHMLAGRIRCIANTEQPIEHLALVIEFPSDKEDAISTLYQQYRITGLPAGWLAVNLALAPTLNLEARAENLP